MTTPLEAQKYGIPRNTISTNLLPANKEKIKGAFSLGVINLKRKNVKKGKNIKSMSWQIEGTE